MSGYFAAGRPVQPGRGTPVLAAMEVARVIVVEDEPLARRRLLRLLADEPQVQVVGECATGSEAVRTIAATACDLVLLDVQLPDLDGFAVLEGVYRPDDMPLVVFVTAYDQYAIRAFEAHAVHYLLKPYEDKRFRAVLHHALHLVRQRRAGHLLQHLLPLLGTTGPTGPAATPVPSAAPAYQDRFLIRNGARQHLVRATEVEWIEATGNYAALHCGKQVHLLRTTLSELTERLDPDLFLRIHRSTILNQECIRHVERLDSGEYQFGLRGGQVLGSSRSYAGPVAEFLRRFA